MTITNFDSQSALNMQETYSPKCLVVCVMMHVMYSIAFTATDVASQFLSFLNANYVKYQVIVNYLNQIIRKSLQISN